MKQDHDSKKSRPAPKLARLDADVEQMDADELELLYWCSAFEVMLPKHAQG